jgi:pyruvate,water dikinase
VTGSPGRDPLHESAETTAAWTTVNISEAFPGVPTPLSWTFFSQALDYCFPAAFADLGVLSRAEQVAATALDQRWSAIFHGRPAINLDLFRRMGDRSPGSSGDAVEEQLFGSVQTSGRQGQQHRGRWPVIAVRTPRTALALPRAVRTAAHDAEQWWRASIAAPSVDADAARDRFLEATRRMREAFRLQLVTAMIVQTVFEQVQRCTRSVEQPQLRDLLLTGYGSFTESALISDLWKASREEIELAHVVAIHGYHGPDEGELSSAVWREDPRDLVRMIEELRSRSDSEGPAARLAGQTKAREEAERILVSRSPMHRRPVVKLILRMARTCLPLREDTKSAFLRVVDVARAAARVIGEAAVAEGRTAHADDVFYLTTEELLGTPEARPWSEVPTRREWRAQHQDTRLPDVWVGAPTPVSASQEEGRSVQGLPVSPGLVEGRARVVTHPDQRDGLEEGDILVCHTTDPSWTPLFFLAAGVAIDIGGPISHGAIVARELGVPCVINTRNGTRVIRDGDQVRLDGSTGSVVILTSPDPSADPSAAACATG